MVTVHLINNGSMSSVKLKGVTVASDWLEINRAIMVAEGRTPEEVENDPDEWKITATADMEHTRSCEMTSNTGWVTLCTIFKHEQRIGG